MCKLPKNSKHIELAEQYFVRAKHVLAEQDDEFIAEYIACLRASVDMGYPPAQVQLGVLHAAGIGVELSEAKALLYFTFAAQAGNLDAHLILSTRHDTGRTVPKICPLAVKHAKPVADEVARKFKQDGIVPAIKKLRIKEDYYAVGIRQTQEDMVQWWFYSASQGDTEAMLILGDMYLQGRKGLEQDGEEAERWYLAALNKEDVNAHGHLGILYARGCGTLKKDLIKARFHFEEGLKHNDTSSLNGYGYMTMEGHKGIPYDPEKAADYFLRSAHQNNVEGLYNVAKLYKEGVGLPQDYHTAHQYFKYAADQGHILSHYELAYLHMNGLGSKSSCKEAFRHYKIVTEQGDWQQQLEVAYEYFVAGMYAAALISYLLPAEQGSEIAIHNVAYILYTQHGYEGIPHSALYQWNYPFSNQLILTDSHNEMQSRYYRHSIHWFQICANMGNHDSMNTLADMYYYGWGYDANYTEAVGFYERAVAKRSAKALFSLAYMYEHGLGVPQDEGLAMKNYATVRQHSETGWVAAQLAIWNLKVRQWWRVAGQQPCDLWGWDVVHPPVENFVGIHPTGLTFLGYFWRWEEVVFHATTTIAGVVLVGVFIWARHEPLVN